MDTLEIFQSAWQSFVVVGFLGVLLGIFTTWFYDLI